MDRVAAKVAQEIGVLFEHDDIDPRARQQEPSIIPAGPPPATQQRVETARQRGLLADRQIVLGRQYSASSRRRTPRSLSSPGKAFLIQSMRLSEGCGAAGGGETF